MLKTILIVTITVARLGPVEQAWNHVLDYESIGRGTISTEIAEVWGAPAVAGHNYLLMRPASGDPTLIRFIEAQPAPGYSPMTSYGWNATELLVQDPDRLADRLAGSSFEIAGPPRDLWDAPDAPRAMQVTGPGQEMLYLTRHPKYATNSFVDRVFIVVVGGPSMDAFRDFYGDRLGLTVGDTSAFRIGVLSKALGLPGDTTYPLAIAAIPPRFLVELDQYPEVASPRTRLPGALPSGVAMVSFEVDALGNFDLDWRGPPAQLSAEPYAGRRSAVTVGPAGEWIEMIETGAESAD